MFLSLSEFRAIIESKPANKELARWIYDQAYLISKIKHDLDELKLEEKVIKSQYKVQIGKINRRRIEIRERCRHLAIDEYVSRPDGTSKHGLCVTCGDVVIEI